MESSSDSIEAQSESLDTNRSKQPTKYLNRVSQVEFSEESRTLNESEFDEDLVENGIETDEEYVPHSRYQIKPPVNTPILKKIISRKRTYRFLSRTTRSNQNKSTMRERWLHGIPMYNDEEIMSIACCKRHCFKSVNVRFLRQKMKIYLQLPYCDRRRVLFGMLSSNGLFVFDRSTVCSKFLEEAFRFSPQLQSDVRKLQTPLSDTFTPNVLHGLSKSSSRSPHETFGISPLSNDSIILFLDRLAKATAESMPDKPQLHLPFFRTADVYEVFTKEFSRLYVNDNYPCYNYFMRVWKMHCSNIQVRKSSRFTKCSLCEQLRSALVDTVRAGQSTEELLNQKRDHNSFVRKERREYFSKMERSILSPKEYISVIVDGADQSAFSLPHFTTKTKDQRGQGLKVHLIGLLQHSFTNNLCLYAMTENHETGSNHIIEVVHRFLNKKSTARTTTKNIFYTTRQLCKRK